MMRISKIALSAYARLRCVSQQAVTIVAASIKLGTLMALTLVKNGRRHALTEQLHKA
jgi:hypothetical protein